MHFNSIEEVTADELFLAWYFRTDESKAKAWEQWLLQHPEQAPLVAEAAKWMSEITFAEKPLPDATVTAAQQRLEQALDAAPIVKMQPGSRRWWIPAAASVLILLAGFAVWKSSDNKKSFETSYGAISEYQLPDGSVVTLNANSEITTGKNWKTGNDREVWLKGEAFFKVQKTSSKDRFVVHTDKMDIIVTGTQFNAISREEETSVLLTEGSVTIRTTDGREILMKPGDFVKMEKDVPALQEIDQQRILAWKQSKLNFERTPMTEVARVITRHYGVKVNLDKTVSNKTISAILPNDNLDVLIRALEATGDYKITRANNEIIISAP